MIDIIFKYLEKKGILATIMGLMFSFPINLRVAYCFFMEETMSDEQLMAACILNLIGMFWFMLPSVIVIKSKLFELRIED